MPVSLHRAPSSLHKQQTSHVYARLVSHAALLEEARVREVPWEPYVAASPSSPLSLHDSTSMNVLPLMQPCWRMRW